ncbi:MAG: hypothetical protein K0Q77_860 [Anaerosporomusa subterranea]|jgi:hypothetical protein|nr:hypothetical protein [Anaerosporomusa subterranea]
MKNVYESVQVFFEEELTEPSIIAREWIEGFLRQKAWSGSTDKELRDIWKQLKALQIYLSYTHYQSLDELVAEDYADAIRWLDLNASGFKASLKSVRHFLAVLDEFYQYLLSRKLIHETLELQVAAEQIAGGKRLNLSISSADGEGNSNSDSATSNAQIPLLPEVGGAIPGTMEKIMLKMGSYFQREDYDEEFHRALYLYVGPLQAIPPLEEDSFSDFWIGFWDYFLFDYHMRQDDLSPVEHYLRSKNRISGVEKTVLQHLSKARYMVFYIQRIIDAEWVECVNLLTDETFRLPYPDFDYKMMKRLLFFGHVFDNGSFATNYIASIEVSVNLRQRVKQEVLRLKELFDIQQPGASWSTFLARHCLAVRHTITLLTTFAKLNVTIVNDSLPVPARPDAIRESDPRVTEQLKQLMPKYGFSSHDLVLAESLWHDFCQVSDVKMRKSGAWTAAVISCYAMMNTPFSVSVDDLADEGGVSVASVYTNRRRLSEALGLRQHDPRYLSEEGILLLLYSS